MPAWVGVHGCVLGLGRSCTLRGTKRMHSVNGDGITEQCVSVVNVQGS